jgi:ABC-type multidrug transport system ATPase subunit
MQKLELTEVSSGYGKNEVIHRINLKITESSIYVVLGPNGAGKTTLFRRINGILKPFSGIVKFDDEDLFIQKNARKRCRLEPQRPLRISNCKYFQKERISLKTHHQGRSQNLYSLTSSPR